MNDTNNNIEALKLYIKMLERENNSLRNKLVNKDETVSEENINDDNQSEMINYREIVKCIASLDIETLILKKNDLTIPQEICALCANELIKRGYDPSLY